jgi:hypothetical protein
MSDVLKVCAIQIFHTAWLLKGPLSSFSTTF